MTVIQGLIRPVILRPPLPPTQCPNFVDENKKCGDENDPVSFDNMERAGEEIDKDSLDSLLIEDVSETNRDDCDDLHEDNADQDKVRDDCEELQDFITNPVSLDNMELAGVEFGKDYGEDVNDQEEVGDECEGVQESELEVIRVTGHVEERKVYYETTKKKVAYGKEKSYKPQKGLFFKEVYQGSANCSSVKVTS